MALTDTAIKNAKPRDRTYKLYDERGLYLEVAPQGGKWWRLKYRFDGKEKRLSVGTYPDVSLKGARDKRDELRTQIAGGVDPSSIRREEKIARKYTFESVVGAELKLSLLLSLELQPLASDLLEGLSGNYLALAQQWLQEA